MATKSKMSTSTIRKVTMKKPGPGDPPKNGSTKQTKEQYEQQWADYQKAYLTNKDYANKMSEYTKQKQKYDKEVASDKKSPRHLSFFGPMRDVTPAELAKINAHQKENSRLSGETYLPYKNVKVNKKVTDIGDGSLVGKGAHHSWYQQPTAPIKPPPLGRQPYNPEYEPKLALKKPGSVKSSSGPAKIIKPKLTTEVPVAVEKPTKKPLPKAKGGIALQKTTEHYKTDAGRKLAEKLLNKSTKQKIRLKSSGFVPADKTARKAVKAENKSTRAARRTFGKEEKLAAGYLKNQGIFEGDTKKEMKAGIKSYAKSKKAETGKIDKTTKQAIKTGKIAAKYVGKQEKGKIRSFTPEALAKRKTVAAKVQKTTTGKGKSKVTTSTIVPTKKSTRTQAGRLVY